MKILTFMQGLATASTMMAMAPAAEASVVKSATVDNLTVQVSFGALPSTISALPAYSSANSQGVVLNGGVNPWNSAGQAVPANLNWLAVGDWYSFGSFLTLDYSAPISTFSFLYGSPDYYGQNVAFYSGTTKVATLTSANLTNAFHSLVYMSGGLYNDSRPSLYTTVSLAGLNVTRVTLTNESGLPFEVADFSSSVAASTSAVPEPRAWAMMILGLGLAGGALRNRVRVARA